MNERQKQILTKLAALVAANVDPDGDWGWGPDGQAGYFGPQLPLNMAPEEVTQYATASCLPDLWALRAYGVRVGIKVPTVDWWYYNHQS
jgi:hypothetical protein